MFGPRGTGKSTWLRHLFPEALFVDLLQPDVYREMHARPERLRELVLGSPQRATVVVDEVQRVPELLNVVHALIEPPARVRSQDLRALKSFVSDYPECEPVLVYRGIERLRIDDIWCVPGEEFLRQIHPARGLTDWV